MAIWDTITDLYDSFTSSFVTEAHADSPEEDSGQVEGDEAQEGEEISKTEEVDEEGGDGDDGGEEGGDEEGEDEEEEEEEEEPVDPKPQLEEDCARSAQCIGFKHHFDDCVERVTAQHEDPDFKGPKEDCVEEFFHLQHCATQCAAPKLFKQLK